MLEYDGLGNVKTDHVNTVVFNLHQIKQSNLFWDTQYYHENCHALRRHNMKYLPGILIF